MIPGRRADLSAFPSPALKDSRITSRADGCPTLRRSVFGKDGERAGSASGVGSLTGNVPSKIEMIVAVRQ
jgi:hypothetical protein